MAAAEKHVNVWPVLQYVRDYLAELTAFVYKLKADDLDDDTKTVLFFIVEELGDLTDAVYTVETDDKLLKVTEDRKAS